MAIVSHLDAYEFDFALHLRGIDCLKTLLGASADVRAVDKPGTTALHDAVRDHWGDRRCIRFCPGEVLVCSDCVKVLIESGADINAKNNSGRTVLFGAALASSLD